jgi:hypothetical protein
VSRQNLTVKAPEFSTTDIARCHGNTPTEDNLFEQETSGK